MNVSDRSVGRGKIFLRSSLLSALVALVTVAAFAFAIVRHERRMVRNHLDERAHLLAASLDRVVGNAVVAEDWGVVMGQCEKIMEAGQHVEYVVITRRGDGYSVVQEKGGGARMVTMGDAWVAPAAGYASTIRTDPFGDDEVLHYSYVFSPDGTPWGWIHIGFTLDEYRGHLADILWIIGTLAVWALSVGTLLSFVFARQLTRPISQLEAFAKRVAGGHFDEQVDVGSNDELGELAESMNQMTADLAGSRAELERSLHREAQLREKEVLLKEIHHRVKNNMQILSSLLRMQARGCDDEKMGTVLRESETRIRSMGLIHEKLYQSKSISEIDFGSYVESLVTELERMHTNGEQNIRLHVDVDEVMLGLDTALPCGLIVNELVSNALKYAFVGRENGSVTVRVNALGKGRFGLCVDDDGVGSGLSANGGRSRRKGALGLSLVEMLVDQLDGEIIFENGNGTRVRIEFLESEYAERM